MFYRFRRAVKRLWPRLNTELVLEHNLETITVIKSKIPIKIFALNLESIHRINEFKKYHLDFLQKRILRGDMCFVSEFNNKIISYHWVQFEGDHFLQQSGRDFLIKEKEIMVYHVRVKENYWGNRVSSAVYSEILNFAKANLKNKVIIYTNKTNVSNRKALDRLGFKITSKIFSVKFDDKYIKFFEKKLNNE